MPSKRHKPEEIVTKLRQVEVLMAQGKTRLDAIRAIGVTYVTFARWKQEYGGLKSDQVKRQKELEQENARLRCSWRTPPRQPETDAVQCVRWRPLLSADADFRG
jgi:putative transposase